MARRVNLPAADNLFRATSPDERRNGVRAVSRIDGGDQGAVRPSGRIRHDEKMTVYVTAAELLEIEHARLTLRREHGMAVDRGRLVREALALVLADLESQGGDSALVQRLLDE